MSDQCVLDVLGKFKLIPDHVNPSSFPALVSQYVLLLEPPPSQCWTQGFLALSQSLDGDIPWGSASGHLAAGEGTFLSALSLCHPQSPTSELIH